MKKRVLSWLLITTIIITSVISNLQLAYTADRVEEDVFNYTLLSLSKEEDLVINSNGGNISGNIASNKFVKISNANKNCKILEKQSKESPDLVRASYEKFFDTLIVENTEKIINDRQNLNINENIRAISDIEISSQTMNGNEVTIISESGNIIIDSNNISLSGFLYAPKGKVKINGDNVNLNNICIIADKIEINANNVNINGSQKIVDWINENIKYDLNEYYLYAFGIYSDSNIKIYWNTNIDDVIDIYESSDNISYSKVTTVKDIDNYNYSIVSEFDEKYIKLSSQGISSVPFVVKQIENGYEISLLDSDNDKIPDVLEEYYGTNALESDTDRDGLTDYEEVVYTKTNPVVFDSVESGIPDGEVDIDKDGLTNKKEIEIGSNPLNVDTDNDGLTDGDEVNFYGTNPILKDTDSDGLSDSSEFRFHTLPLNPDSNDNGILDGDETYSQELQENCYEETLLQDNVAIPSIHVLQKGDASDSTKCLEYDGHLKGDDCEFIGKCVEVVGSNADSGTISFKLDTDYKVSEYNIGGEETNGLLICANIDEITVPLKTSYDAATRTLSAEFKNDAIYFVMDTVSWLESLGIDANEVANDINESNNEKYASSTYSMISTYDSADNIRLNSSSKTPGLTIAGKPVSGQVDVVFIVDTTSSMGPYIDNVKDNINGFVDRLVNANIKPNFALVEYRDITCDGIDSTKVQITSSSDSYWFSSADTFKTLIESLSVNGGGDTPETAIDGLEFARRLNMRKNSQKFFILVTDADYKTDNNYNIANMDEMIELLEEDNINTSVITLPWYIDVYKDLYTITGGIYADISENFKNELLAIADRIIETTNDGSWIALYGLVPQLVKLKAEPIIGSSIDTDDDGLTDVEELDNLEHRHKYNAADFVSGIYFKTFTTPIDLEKWDIYVYMYSSNPAEEDTDGDGLLDGKAITIDYEGKKIIAAPKDDQPKVYSGQKGLWDEHIRSMNEKDKLATTDGKSYYFDIKSPFEEGFLQFINSIYSSAESVGCDFRYDNRNIAIHSYGFQWQIVGGYNDIYDMVFDAACSMNKLKLDFAYNDINYAIWAWKGTYLSLGAGSEVGFYENNNPLGLWEASDRQYMSCSLYHRTSNGYSTIYNWYPKERQWWTTGFQPDEYIWNQEELAQIASVRFDNPDMYNTFYNKYKNNVMRDNIVFDEQNNEVWLVW